MATIKLDVVYGEQHRRPETLTDALMELTKDLDITFDELGSHVTSGWPEIEFSGPVGDLEVLVHRYAGPNDFDLFSELLHVIKE